MSRKHTMLLPEGVVGFSMRGIELEVTKTDKGFEVDVPEDLVEEAKETGLVVIRSPEPDAPTAEQKAQEDAILKAEADAAKAKAEQDAKDAAEAKAKADAEAAEKAKAEALIIKEGDTVTFEDSGNQLEGVVKAITTTKKGTKADVEVKLPDADPETWEVDFEILTKVMPE